MRTVNLHEAEDGFAMLLAEVEQHGERIVICRNGKPVADLVPHQGVDRSQPDAEMRRIEIKCDPTEELSVDDWPADSR